MANIAPRSMGSLAHRGMSHGMAAAYAELWRTHKITHALTISPGSCASGFDRTTLEEVLKRLVKEASHELRCVSRRQLRNMDPRDLIHIAGFVEDRMRTGAPFFHWHGGVALRGAEEIALRNLLWRCVGEDSDNPLQPHEPSRTEKLLLPSLRTPLTFHFQRQTTPQQFIQYANKHASDFDFDFLCTLDFCDV